MELFDLSYSGVTRIRNGTRGLPMQRGLACRPWELRSRKLVDRWYTQEIERVEARRKRALETIAANEVLCLSGDAVYAQEQTERLFEGVGKGRRWHMSVRNVEPKRLERESWLHEEWPKRAHALYVREPVKPFPAVSLVPCHSTEDGRSPAAPTDQRQRLDGRHVVPAHERR
jgi:hypothetical protein